MAKVKKKLGEILVSSGVITEEILQKVLVLQKNSGKKLGETLVTEGFTTEDQIMEAVKNQLGIQYINLDSINIAQDTINTIPETLARKHELIPVEVVNGQLLVAMADPLNYYAIEEIRLHSGLLVKTAISRREVVLNNIEKYYGQSKAKEAADDYVRAYGIRPKEVVQTNEVNENSAPIIKFLNTIIESAILNGASDIHIEPEETEFRVRFRIDGVLKEMMRTNAGMLDPVVSRIKIMANLNIAEKRVPQDGRINYRVKEKNIDLRVSTAPTMWGEKIVMRILDKSSFSLSLNTLGVENMDMEKIKSIIGKPYGVILVCGPTGSGKTTTLYSFLNILNEESKNIITIEDPVEYNFKGINQMQVNPKVGFTFASGLRSILRQDPDIIMVGEIRDGETAEIAVRAALTGHLVLTTIHTNSAAGTITRLEDMGLEPFLLSSTIVGIIAQRLVRKICPNCGEDHVTDQREMRILGLHSPVTIRRGQGCSLCNNTGYKGRIGIYEVMPINAELRQLIDEKTREREIEEAALRNGMTLLREACKRKVLSGATTVEELLRVTYSTNE
ncbi:GspE/PulE family protein [Clostridium thermarum]|uniref:GspE/PulE family protein n=1 Tax=Clostridium thermarum TaxID=1716543 RepID=UPI0013D1C994|nr:ATPase, T2SS/T4P/T4SS family [Clostridium thermarum]